MRSRLALSAGAACGLTATWASPVNCWWNARPRDDEAAATPKVLRRTTLKVDKEKSMRDFYVGVLGATPVDGDVRIGDSLISFAPRDTQETTKEVFVSMNHPSDSPDIDVKSFADVEAARLYLVHQVATHAGSVVDGTRQYIVDPEGNMVELKLV